MFPEEPRRRWAMRHLLDAVHGDAGRITCGWEHAAKLGRVLAQLDGVFARHVEAAATYHEARLAALAPYRRPAPPRP